MIEELILYILATITTLILLTTYSQYSTWSHIIIAIFWPIIIVVFILGYFYSLIKKALS